MLNNCDFVVVPCNIFSRCCVAQIHFSASDHLRTLILICIHGTYICDLVL